MARIVMSLAAPRWLASSASGVARVSEWEAGNQVVVVVSAMAGETDRLVNFCREASSPGRSARI